MLACTVGTEPCTAPTLPSLHIVGRSRGNFLIAQWKVDAHGAAQPHTWPSGIPMTIHMTCADKRPGVGDCTQLLTSPAKSIALWSALNPGFQIAIVNESEASAFVSHEFPELAHTYRSIPQWAHRVRSDLWRALYLIRHGGTYADADIEPVASLRSIVEPGDTLVTSGSLNAGFVNPHIIITPPGSPVLKVALQFMLHSMRRSLLKYPSGKMPGAQQAYVTWTLSRGLGLAFGKQVAQVAKGIRNRTATLADIGVRLLRETKVETKRCRGCELGSGNNVSTKTFRDRVGFNRSETWLRKATAEPRPGSRILLLNKYASLGGSGAWWYTDSQPLREAMCARTCL